MHFGFALELSDIDLWNIDLLDTHLDLLDTDIPSKYFVCLHSVFKTSSRYVFKTSSRHVFKTSSRHLEDVLKTWHFLANHLQHGWSCYITSLNMDDLNLSHLLSLYAIAKLSIASILPLMSIFSCLCLWSKTKFVKFFISATSLLA